MSHLPPEVSEQILAAAVDSLHVKDLLIPAFRSDAHGNCCTLRAYLQLRAVCSGWRRLLDSLPLTADHLHLTSGAPACHQSMPPLEVFCLHVYTNPGGGNATIKSLDALLTSETFRQHSGACLASIESPAFTLSADSAAAFPRLTCIQRLDVRAVPPQLPPSLKRLRLEGDAVPLTRLPPDVVSAPPQLDVLVLHNIAVEIERLPRSLWHVDLINVEPGPALQRALQLAAHRLPANNQPHLDGAPRRTPGGGRLHPGAGLGRPWQANCQGS